ncbi:GvpL/GvpF family gas vesicle protein [Tumidithrix elongata RA019]|uniref:GvpL/GvpF family gas vesicle protein n=1 Tax=Tumidithrix elongata BACA0141 TaxID=2716417 RepID=A0AAW9Q2X9_9CYAN|nr:GvpL/GvpF family gas vesicle protein [Tumidithrix elongata RA019]
MLYAFAILAAPIPTMSLLGIEGKPIACIQAGELVIALDPNLNVEALKETTEEILLQAVLQHDRVICELYSQHNLLPLRFGTAFVSEAALREYLIVNQQELSDRLRGLEGYAEYLLKGKANLPKPEMNGNLKGRDYLLAKREQYLQQQQVQVQLQSEVQELYGFMQQTSRVAPKLIQEAEEAKAHLLLTPLQAEQLSQFLQTWQLLHSHWQFEMSDALPPYHFAE